MRKLKLSDWASIAELVSAIAVIISLLYVGIQVKENTNEIRAANRQQLVSRTHTATQLVAANPELAGIFTKIAEGTTLSAREHVQFDYFVYGMLKDMEEGFLLYREGRLDEEYWQTRVAITLNYLAQTPARDVYRRRKKVGYFQTAFVKWLDQALNESDGG